MEMLKAVWTWLVLNWDTLLAAAFAIEVVAVQLVNLTPTPKDNKVLIAVHKVLVVLANLVPNTKVTPKKLAAEEAMKTLT